MLYLINPSNKAPMMTGNIGQYDQLGFASARAGCTKEPTRKVHFTERDHHEHRLIMLENGMEALLISDPTTDKAAAAMDVKVGHLSDPEDLQGLAHFCEHLMFMGTEKVSCCSRRRRRT